MQVSLATIPNALEIRRGLPHPNWPKIIEWLESKIAVADLDWNDAWMQLASDWVETLISSLPLGYHRTESKEFTLLANVNKGSADRILGWCESARHIILSTLPGVACDDGYGKHIIFSFNEANTYYDYVTDLFPGVGKSVLPDGVFIDRGYGHIAMCTACRDSPHVIIVHELCHALLRHLPLPVWLSEGFAQFMEGEVAGHSELILDYGEQRLHGSYWNSETIQLFWSGASFDCGSYAQELSYQLALSLFRSLFSEFPHQICALLRSAHYSDAGESALNTVCHVSLGDRVARLIGKGEWSPRTDYAADLA